ncbi:hypothetical protein PC128_g7069 [Phytophthora cactorum]|nr:hypothetical protein PC120_g4150 [Phytophthora cactorum]KAG3081027.1 hypothetical protein PC121_g6596 [Phytophthora cactorum]KAG3197142.1 hypothetical protein PC128_g7069 [Phytophthora cactorum]KAG4060564.1 hypothetical protein PC123_g4528 [Phytophthora cactorum]
MGVDKEKLYNMGYGKKNRFELRAISARRLRASAQRLRKAGSSRHFMNAITLDVLGRYLGRLPESLRLGRLPGSLQLGRLQGWLLSED